MKASTTLFFSLGLVLLHLSTGSAGAALVSGFDQRYQADDYNTGTGVWDDSVSASQDTTSLGTFSTTTTPNGSTAVVNTGSGTRMPFTRDSSLAAAGFTIQAVIRIDAGNTDSRQSPFGLDQTTGWGGLYMGARANDVVRVRAGNQNGTSSGTVLQTDSTMSVSAGTWGIYTLITDTSVNPTMTATFDLLSDGSTVFSTTDDHGTANIIGIGTAGSLFAGEHGGGLSASDQWLGAIADVVVYNSVLSASDLTQNESAFQAVYSVPEPSAGVLAAFGLAVLFFFQRKRAQN